MLIEIYCIDSEKVPVELQIDNIIQQLRTLSDEAIAILYEDGLLSSEYIDERPFRVQEHLYNGNQSTLKKFLHHKILCGKLRHPVKRPQKLDLSWFNQQLIPKRTKTDHPHTPRINPLFKWQSMVKI